MRRPNIGNKYYALDGDHKPLLDKFGEKRVLTCVSGPIPPAGNYEFRDQHGATAYLLPQAIEVIK